MNLPRQPHDKEHLQWLLDSVQEMLRTGTAKSVHEALGALLPEWIEKTGRTCGLGSLRNVLVNHARRVGVVLPSAAPNAKAPPAPQVSAEQVAHASYAVWIPGTGGAADQLKMFTTSGEVGETINAMVRENMGFLPKGIKIFGEIVPEINVQVTWKNRGMPVLSPGANGHS